MPKSALLNRVCAMQTHRTESPQEPLNSALISGSLGANAKRSERLNPAPYLDMRAAREARLRGQVPRGAAAGIFCEPSPPREGFRRGLFLEPWAYLFASWRVLMATAAQAGARRQND